MGMILFHAYHIDTLFSSWSRIMMKIMYQYDKHGIKAGNHDCVILLAYPHKLHVVQTHPGVHSYSIYLKMHTIPHTQGCIRTPFTSWGYANSITYLGWIHRYSCHFIWMCNQYYYIHSWSSAIIWYTSLIIWQWHICHLYFEMTCLKIAYR